MTRTFPAILFSILAAAFATTTVAADPDPALWAGMSARSIGPAGMSGRVAAVVAVPSDPNVVWVGSAAGGVFKSTNRGLTWTAMFDDEAVASIGAIAVFEPNPDLVWVGTGEGNPRNSVSVGGGLYRSRDGGANWTLVGLEATERIHRVITHPTDPDVVWVAALGRMWGENPERGVFKTTDGGATWRRVLYVDERTGCADLVLDPQNPDKLMAAMWDYRRRPWSFRSGGPGSGLHVTHDGGETWQRRTPEDGLPAGDLGRIGLAIAPSDPDVVYAIVEAKKSVLLRSTDGGRTFKNTGAARAFGNRPFYFADLRVDPQRPNRVYSLWSVVSVSEDGGATWRILVPWQKVHPDHHALWIDPADGRRLILGNDGGVAFSDDRGDSWRFASNLPLAQFYHVRVDDDVPYHVYGGLQDNGSWRGPSSVWENGGIRNHHWEEVGFGDGFDTVPDPRDTLRGYAMSQQGYLIRWDLRTGERTSVRPAPPAGETLRFNWNAAIAIDPFDPAHLWYGSQFVHESRDGGDTWRTISPDLSTNDAERQRQDASGGLTPDVTGAENFTTIVALAPSPLKRDVLWAGTDDGRVWITRDGGGDWASVERGARGVPAGTWVPHVEPSRHAADAAYVVFDNHRRSDLETYAFRVTEHGARWTRLATRGVRGYALSIVEDPLDPDLLFLGTEFGLYVSRDAGASWFRWTHGVPTTSVMDLAIQAREQDLVIGTHGRGVFILDDLRPLRELTDDVAARPLHVFGPVSAQQHVVKQTGASRFPGDGEFRGANEPYGALLSVWVGVPDVPHPDDERERERQVALRAKQGADPGDETPAQDEDEDDGKDKMVVRVRRASDGTIVRAFRRDATQGLNRVVWDLTHDPFLPPEDPDDVFAGFGGGGPQVAPGEYRVELELREHRAETSIAVVGDPRLDVSADDLAANWAAIERVGGLRERLRTAVDRIRAVRRDADVVLAKAKNRWDVERAKSRGDELPAGWTTLETADRALRKALDEAERRLWAPPGTQGIVADDHALGKVGTAWWFIGGNWGRPTAAQLRYIELAEAAVADGLAAVDAAMAGEVAAFRTLAGEQAFELFGEVDAAR